MLDNTSTNTLSNSQLLLLLLLFGLLLIRINLTSVDKFGIFGPELGVELTLYSHIQALNKDSLFLPFPIVDVVNMCPFGGAQMKEFCYNVEL